LKSAVQAPEEFATDLPLRIEYRISERDCDLLVHMSNPARYVLDLRQPTTRADDPASRHPGNVKAVDDPRAA